MKDLQYKNKRKERGERREEREIKLLTYMCQSVTDVVVSDIWL